MNDATDTDLGGELISDSLSDVDAPTIQFFEV